MVQFTIGYPKVQGIPKVPKGPISGKRYLNFQGVLKVPWSKVGKRYLKVKGW